MGAVTHKYDAARQKRRDNFKKFDFIGVGLKKNQALTNCINIINIHIIEYIHTGRSEILTISVTK